MALRLGVKLIDAAQSCCYSEAVIGEAAKGAETACLSPTSESPRQLQTQKPPQRGYKQKVEK